MENFGLEPLRTTVQIIGEEYTVSVWRDGEQLELEIEEPSAKKSLYVWTAGKLISRQYQPDKFELFDTALPNTIAIKPLHETVTPEMQEAAAKALEEYLQCEQVSRAGRS